MIVALSFFAGALLGVTISTILFCVVTAKGAEMVSGVQPAELCDGICGYCDWWTDDPLTGERVCLNPKRKEVYNDRL